MREATIEELQAAIEQLGPFASIATVGSGGMPHIVPVRSAWVDDHVYFGGSLQTAKIRHLQARPRAALQFQSKEADGIQLAGCLLVKGNATVLTDPEDKHYYWHHPQAFPTSYRPPMYSGWEDPALCFVRLDPTYALFVAAQRGAVQDWPQPTWRYRAPSSAGPASTPGEATVGS